MLASIVALGALGRGLSCRKIAPLVRSGQGPFKPFGNATAHNPFLIGVREKNPALR